MTNPNQNENEQKHSPATKQRLDYVSNTEKRKETWKWTKHDRRDKKMRIVIDDDTDDDCVEMEEESPMEVEDDVQVTERRRWKRVRSLPPRAPQLDLPPPYSPTISSCPLTPPPFIYTPEPSTPSNTPSHTR